MNERRIPIRPGLKAFRSLAFYAAACLSGIPSAQAACVSSTEQLPQQIALPATTIAASPNLSVGAPLGSVRVAAPHDIPFECTGDANVREVRLAGTPAPVPDSGNVSRVYSTSLAGVGMRVTVSGGSFAGIDDGPRPAPYQVALPPHANHLTGFGVQIDFVKTGAVQDGVLAAGKLLTVLVGGTELIEVDIPRDTIVFASTSQCDALHAGGSVATGIGTAGAFSYESLAVSTGCNPGIGVMVQLDQGYVYGSRPLLMRENSSGSTAAAASVQVGHASRKVVDSASPSFAAGGASTFGVETFGANATGAAGRPTDFRR